jgi:diphthamide synthase (EF-2-diphthine--ammonia ligase)
VDAVAFGDLYLEDVRAYREKQLAGTGLEPMFPLWKRPTDELARTMIAGGQRARLTCVDPKKVPGELAGREFDLKLLAELPAGVDPCGENGEFHSFVYESPAFAAPIAVRPGEVVERDGFVFADVLPA